MPTHTLTSLESTSSPPHPLLRVRRRPLSRARGRRQVARAEAEAWEAEGAPGYIRYDLDPVTQVRAHWQPVSAGLKWVPPKAIRWLDADFTLILR